MFTKTYYVYQQTPVDFRFGSMTLEEVIKIKVNEMDFKNSYDIELSTIKGDVNEINEIINFRNRSLSMIKDQLGRNENDMRHDGFFFVPGELSMLIGYIMKQDNNGTTYVVSPVPPHDTSITDDLTNIERE